jgi:ABC-2 type transport system permease protein
VLVVVGAIVGSSCYLLQQGFQSLVRRFVEPELLETVRLLPILRWLPPGSMAQVIVSAADRQWTDALLWLGYGLLWLLLLAWVWWQLSSRLITGGGFLVQGGARARKEERAQPRRASRNWRWLPADLQQLIAKEFRLIWRTPQRRVGLLQGFLFPLLMVGYSVIGSGLPDELPPWLGFSLPIFAIFTAWIAGQNALGMEGKGLPLLLLTPLPRYRFWLAKGIVNFVLTATPVLLLGLVAIAMLPTWQSAAGLLTIPGVVLVTLGITHLGSIFFPYPVRTEGRQVRSNTRGGCIAGLGNGVLLPAVIGLACVPPALFLAGAHFLSAPWLGWAGGLFSLIYGLLIFAGAGVVASGRLLLQREAEMIAATKLPDAD